jgi:hypothetical protein
MKKITYRKLLRELVLSLLVFTGMMIASESIHRGNGYFNWKSEIWGDKAGYYIYLPATFYYHFNLDEFAPRIDERTGYGFYLDRQSGKMNTKYTCGVALLASPFFVTAHYVSKIFHIPQDWGFSPLYHRMMNVAAVFYLVLGIWLLKRFLENYMKELPAALTVLFVLLGTNLLYYATTESLMSHVYSFFLFSLLLFSFKKFLTAGRKYPWLLVVSVAFGLIVLVRPFNLVILPFVLLWDLDSKEAFKERIKLILKPRHLLTFLVLVFLVFLPQMLYWKYLTGSFFHYSYGKEGFTNWAHPRIAEVWFSTLNGLFLYNPLVLVFVAGIIWMIFRRRTNGILLLTIFLLISWIFSSWTNWYFGCSFGQRPFVEFYSFFALPFGLVLQRALDRKSLLLKMTFFTVIAGFCYYSIAIMSRFERCFFGSVWDWNQFAVVIGKSGIYPPYRDIKTFTNDFENQMLSPGAFVIDSVSRSGRYSMLVNPDPVRYCVYQRLFLDFGPKGPRQVTVGFHGMRPGPDPVTALVTCTADLGEMNLFRKSEYVGSLINRPGEWCPVTVSFEIPEHVNRFAYLKVYIRNHGTSNYFIDDLKILFKN